MLKRVLPILLALTVFLSACATPAEPTANPVDIQNTAVAAAWTMVQATNNAIPTNTPLPPTEVPSQTPLPTFTLEIFPTLPGLEFPTPTLAASGSGDPCAKILNVALAGTSNRKYIRVENLSNGNASFGMTLTSPNSFGQCGYLTGFNNILKKGAKVKMYIPAGCWYFWAFIEEKSGSQHTAEGTHCLGDSKTDDLLRLVIKDYTMGIVGP